MSLFFLICTMLVSSCSKSIDATLSTPASVYTPGDIAADPAFTGLYDALNHFDPRYLQVVYNDQRTIAEINTGAATLIKQIELDPKNQQLQQELADTYRFKNIDELKYFSNQIEINAATIKNKYYAHVTKFSSKDVATYFKARSIYARNRMDSVKNIEKIKPSSMYDDYVLNPEPPAFAFFGEMDLEGLDVGGLGGCKDACCLDFQACNTTARARYLENFYSTKLNSVASSAVIGSAFGTAISPVGGIVGSIGGVYLGTYIGASVANEIYSLEKQSCLLLYQSCLKRSSK